MGAYEILDWVFAGKPPSSRATEGMRRLEALRTRDGDSAAIADVGTMLARLGAE